MLHGTFGTAYHEKTGWLLKCTIERWDVHDNTVKLNWPTLKTAYLWTSCCIRWITPHYFSHFQPRFLVICSSKYPKWYLLIPIFKDSSEVRLLVIFLHCTCNQKVLKTGGVNSCHPNYASFSSLSVSKVKYLLYYFIYLALKQQPGAMLWMVLLSVINDVNLKSYK